MQHGQGWIHVDGGFGGQLTDFFYGNFCERFFFEQFQKCVLAIYIKEFVDVCDEMTRRYDNPLYIPEEEFSDVQAYLFGVDTGDAALKVPQDVEEYGWYNRTMQSMMPLLVSRYGTDGLQAVCSERKEEDTMLFGTFGFRILMDTPMITRRDGVWKAGRRLNGDEAASLKFEKPLLRKIRLHAFV